MSTEYEIKEIRLSVSENPEDIETSEPEQVVGLARDILQDKADGKEHFFAIHVDSHHNVKAIDHVSMGSLTASIVHPREVFRPAVANGAHSVIFFHNHPSGDVEPSEEDIEITERLEEAGDIMGIPVLDHVIIGGNGIKWHYKSFDDLNLLNKK